MQSTAEPAARFVFFVKKMVRRNHLPLIGTEEWKPRGLDCGRSARYSYASLWGSRSCLPSQIGFSLWGMLWTAQRVVGQAIPIRRLSAPPC